MEILIKFYGNNGKLWTILCLSLVSMRGHTHHIFDAIWIPSEQVTKLPLKRFMLFRIPLIHLDYWLAFLRKFPPYYTCSWTNSRKENFVHFDVNFVVLTDLNYNYQAKKSAQRLTVGQIPLDWQPCTGKIVAIKWLKWSRRLPLTWSISAKMLYLS